MLKLVRGQLHLVDLHDGVPELLVLLLEHDDEAGGLRVEGAGDVLDGVGDELLDAAVRDGGFVGQLVVGAAGLDGLEQVLGVRHCGCGYSTRGMVGCLLLLDCCCCCCCCCRKRRVDNGGEIYYFRVVAVDRFGEGWCELPKQLLRFVRGHNVDLRDLKRCCENEEYHGGNGDARSLHVT